MADRTAREWAAEALRRYYGFGPLPSDWDDWRYVEDEGLVRPGLGRAVEEVITEAVAEAVARSGPAGGA